MINCNDYIEGEFVLWWSGKSYKCHERSIYIPKYAAIKITPDRIYIDNKYVTAQFKLYNELKNNIWKNRDDFYELKKFINALNKPYIKPKIFKSSIKTELI